MQFQINLYSEYPQEIEYSKRKIRDDARDFQEDYLAVHPELTEDKKLNTFFEDLKNGRFWGILAYLDGPLEGSAFDSDPVKKVEQIVKAREWRQKTFDENNLQKIFDIVLNTALIVPYSRSSWPGTYRGHSILLRDIVERNDSMFKSSITPDLEKRLVNGCFWEEIYEMTGGLNHGMSYCRVEYVLREQYDKLSTDFAKKGLEIFYRNLGHNGIEREPDFDLNNLSKESLENWIIFAKKIDEQKEKIGVSEKDIAQLIRPYLLSFLEIDFEKGDDVCPEEFIEKMKDPFIRKYAQDSEMVRNTATEAMQNALEYREKWVAETYLMKFLTAFPNSEEIVQNLFAYEKLSNERRVMFADLCKRNSFSLDKVLDKTNLAKIQTARYELAKEKIKRARENKDEIKDEYDEDEIN